MACQGCLSLIHMASAGVVGVEGSTSLTPECSLASSHGSSLSIVVLRIMVVSG